MFIHNDKTNVSFIAHTVYDRTGGYAAVVSKRIGNNQKSISRVVYPTRSKAYYNAVKLCKVYAANHAYIN